jgi:aspartate/methionine/tyrosine aminotransferase
LGKKQPVFSSRTRLSLTPNDLTQRCSALRDAGVELLDLTSTNPTEVGLFDDCSWLSLLKRPAGALYQPAAFGLMSARRAVAQMYAAKGLSVVPEQVVLCASTSEAYSWLFKLLTDPGEQILVPRPSYPLLEHLARWEDVHLAHYAISYDGAYFVDLNSLRQACSPTTRAVVLVSPNNPTGSYTRRSELGAIVDLDVPIISDEVFADYPLSSVVPEVPSALVAESSLVFALGGLSKSLAWPQLKLAWIIVAGPTNLRSEALCRLELIADSYLSPNTPVQVALPELLDQGAQRHAQVQQRLRQNYAALTRLIQGSPVSLRPIQGGWSAVLRLPLTAVQEWAALLLEEQHLVVQPGWFYDFAEDGIVIVSLLTPEASFAEGISRLLHCVSTLG